MRLELHLKDIDHKLIIQEGDIKGQREDLKQFWQTKEGDFLLMAHTSPSK